jgi:Nucleotidyl transferase AbiEii toxin, Type IV TA system
VADEIAAEPPSESYVTLSREDRLAALGVAATAFGPCRPSARVGHLGGLGVAGLFESELGEHLVFKGGTSLSNGYDIIQRFSEDVDLTYDIRQIIPELVTGNPPLPANNSQAKKLTETARERLKTWVKDTTLPVLAGPAVIACRRRYHCPAFGCLLNGSRDCTWSGVPPLRVAAMLTLLRVPLLILSLLSPVFTCADLLNILTLEIFRPRRRDRAHPPSGRCIRRRRAFRHLRFVP